MLVQLAGVSGGTLEVEESDGFIELTVFEGSDIAGITLRRSDIKALIRFTLETHDHTT